MKKIASIVAILLSVFCMLPATLSAATATQPVIWEDTDGDGYEDYTDSLGNMWMTLTIDEEGNRLIVSKEILGVTEFEEDFDGSSLTPDTTTVYNDYATSDLKEEMDKFYNGVDDGTKINDTVYYLAPELKAIAQPVVLPDDEEVTFGSDGLLTSATGGMSYVDESGEVTCFALSISETITYLADGVITPGTPISSMTAVHSDGSNYADTGEDYDKNVNNYPKPGDPHVDHPTNGGSGWTTRSAADANYNVAKVNSSGLIGRDYTDNNGGFRPALWVGEADSDMDGIPDEDEVYFGYDPLDPDMDDDGLTDGEEVGMKIDPRDPDTDDDGLTDGEEVNLYNTDPYFADSDNDGLLDGEEVALGINPLSTDSDNDGLLDGEEITLGTDPSNADSDNDGVTDGEEVAAGTDPLTNNTTINDDTNEEETLEETGSAPFVVFFAIAVSAFAIALYTRFRATK